MHYLLLIFTNHYALITYEMIQNKTILTYVDKK